MANFILGSLQLLIAIAGALWMSAITWRVLSMTTQAAVWITQVSTLPLQLSPRISLKSESLVMRKYKDDSAQIHPSLTEHSKLSYTISDSSLCSMHKPEMLIWIYSAPTNVNRRVTLRNMWANATLYEPIYTRVVFSLAATLSSVVQKAIDNEQAVYGDIIQDGTFIDAYVNLTYKAQGMLRWTTTYCKHIKLLFKTDDDSFIVPSRLTKWMNQQFKANNTWPTKSVIGEVWNNPTPYRSGKYSVPIQQVPEKAFAPKACPGSGYLITGDSLPLLVQSIDQTSFVWLEDMYTTGRLAHSAGLSHIPINKHHIHVYNRDTTLTDLRNIDRAVFIVGQIPDGDFLHLWKEFQV